MTEDQTEVLIVDDDSLVRSAVKRVLNNASFKVVSASSAHEALSLLRAGRTFAVIVTDLVMPGTGGTQFIRLLRQFDRDTPVIVF